MDVLTDKRPAVKSQDTFGDGRYEDGFWVICTEGGTVSACSRIASDFGITAGVTTAFELIDKRDIAVFEDLIRRGVAGGDASAELTAAVGTDFPVVRVKVMCVFSAISAELRFFRSKEEYLAASVTYGERLGRVFGYFDNFASRIGEITERLREFSGESPVIGDAVKMLSLLSEEYSSGGRLFIENCNAVCDPDERVCDIPKIFGSVADLSCNGGELPFSADFRDMTNGEKVIADTDPRRITGIIMMAATVVARLSRNNSCSVVLNGDEDFVYVEAKCRLRDGYHLFGRSDDLSGIYRCIPANPVELMILEQLCSVPEWHLEYSADADGNLILRAALFRDTNPDRLRFRDSAATVGDTLRRYFEYIVSSYSPDPQEQGQD